MNKLLYFLLPLTCLAISCLIIFSAFNTRTNTGVVEIKTSDLNAPIYVTQKNRQSVLLGKGAVKVRLAPGKYLFFSSNQFGVARKVVEINKQDKVVGELKINTRPLVNSIDNVNFQSFDSLLNSGLNDQQLDILKEYFFDYDPSATKVSVIPSTVYPRPRNPDTATSFIIDFGVEIDSKKLSATIEYSTDYDMSLVIKDSLGRTVYNSSKTKAQQPHGE